jgi:hypothetical protein
MGDANFDAAEGLEHLRAAAWAESDAIAAKDNQMAILDRLGRIEAQLSALQQGGAPCPSVKECLLGDLVVTLGQALVVANTRAGKMAHEINRLRGALPNAEEKIVPPTAAPGSALRL